MNTKNMSFNTGYRVKLLCFDSTDGVSPYEDSPAVNPIFPEKAGAFLYARQLAEDECNGLNGADGTDPAPGVSFGIPEDDKYQNGEAVVVCQYYCPDGDDTGETNQVTVYFLEECKYALLEEAEKEVVAC